MVGSERYPKRKRARAPVTLLAGTQPVPERPREVRCGSKNHELFVAQCRIGIQARGAARGNIRSEQRDERKKHSHAGECDWVRGADSEKESGQKARDDEGGSNANSHAENREPSAFARDQTQYVAALRAERHSNADLLGAACNRKGHNSVDADCRKRQSSGSK